MLVNLAAAQPATIGGFNNNGGRRHIDAGDIQVAAANSKVNIGQSLTTNVGGDYALKMNSGKMTGDNTVMNFGLQNLIVNTDGTVDIDFGSQNNAAKAGRLNIGQRDYQGGTVNMHGKLLENTGTDSWNVIGLLNLQKVNLDNLGNTGSHTMNRVGKLGGDVTIKTVGNAGDYSVNEIGLLNLQKVNLDTLGNTGSHTMNRVGKLGGDVTIKAVGNDGDYSVNEIGLLNLQKVNLDTLGNTGSHTMNRVGKLGGDVVIKTVGNDGDYSVNEIGLLNLKNTISVDHIHSASTGGGTLVGTKGDSDITAKLYTTSGSNTHDQFGKKGSSQNLDIGKIVSEGTGTVTDFWLL